MKESKIITHIVEERGILVLAGRPNESGSWIVPPTSRPGVCLIQVPGTTTAHVVVKQDGAWWIAFFKADVFPNSDEIEWHELKRNAPEPTNRFASAIGWVWGKAKALVAPLASKQFLGYLLVAGLTLGATQFVGRSGCDWVTPTPNPVDPVDPPGPAPIPSDKLAVAFFHESADNLTKVQQSAIHGAATRDYIKAKGGEWRFFDKDTVVTDPFWAKLAARPRTSLPWVVVTNGKASHEGPVDAGTLDKIKKVGG